MTLPVPKRGITPRELYHDYVPQLWAALVGPVQGLPPVCVGVVVKGDAAYTITVTPSGLVTTDGAPEGALLTFSTDLASWRIALLELLPRLLKHLTPYVPRLRIAEHLQRLDLETLRKKPGSMTHVYEDDAGDEATVVVTIGTGGKAAASIKVTDSELWKLLQGGVRLSQLLNSRIQVRGDLGWVLDLARVIENR